jgi:hypothetical protein
LRIEPDQVEQLQGAHRITQTGLDRAIDFARFGNAGLDEPDRVVIKRHQEIVEDEAGMVLGLYRSLPERLTELPCFLESRLTALDSR